MFLNFNLQNTILNFSRRCLQPQKTANKSIVAKHVGLSDDPRLYLATFDLCKWEPWSVASRFATLPPNCALKHTILRYTYNITTFPSLKALTNGFLYGCNWNKNTIHEVWIWFCPYKVVYEMCCMKYVMWNEKQVNKWKTNEKQTRKTRHSLKRNKICYNSAKESRGSALND